MSSVNTNKELKVMVFIYNAIENGWEVKKLDSGKYQFRKRNQLDFTNASISNTDTIQNIERDVSGMIRTMDNETPSLFKEYLTRFIQINSTMSRLNRRLN